MRFETTQPALCVCGLLQEPLRTLLQPFEQAIQKLFSFDRLQRIWDRARSAERLLELLDIRCEVDPGDIGRIPSHGPVLVVANHPFGLLDGAVLATLLPRVRPDVRILANSILSGAPELHDRCIWVDPFGRKDAVRQNARALRDCVLWLNRGGLLAAFPAGEVAHIDWKNRTVAEPPWNPAIARLALKSDATVVPVHFGGSNSLLFQLAGMLHPDLRTASLPRELLNKRGRQVRIRVGRPVEPATLRALGGAPEAVEYLRCRTCLLDPGDARPSRAMRAVAPAQDPRELEREIAALPAERKLCEAGELAVYVATAPEIPSVLPEIGRLREVSFRGAGEGTGRPLDLDRFDEHYLHLMLWNRAAREVVGAYRLGPTPDILPRFGSAGLYTSTLFRYRPPVFEELGPAIELGRSFVRPEYQKQYAPLLMLWKGIGSYVATRPECAVLFGGVSISNDYNPVSRHLIVRFLEAHRVEPLSSLVTPRRPYRPDPRALRRTGLLESVAGDMESLSALISGLESDGKGVPILVKQYLKSGGRLLGFNVDPGFADTLDALIMVDLREAPDPLLERYLGKPGAASFAAFHGRESKAGRLLTHAARSRAAIVSERLPRAAVAAS